MVNEINKYKDDLYFSYFNFPFFLKIMFTNSFI